MISQSPLFLCLQQEAMSCSYASNKRPLNNAKVRDAKHHNALRIKPEQPWLVTVDCAEALNT